MNNIQDNLGMAANLSQFYSLYLLLKDATNGEIMRELQNQDAKYFEDIVARLERLEKKIDLIIGDNDVR